MQHVKQFPVPVELQGKLHITGCACRMPVRVRVTSLGLRSVQVARWVLLEPLAAWDLVTLSEYTLCLEESGQLTVKSNSVKTGVLGELVGDVLSNQLLPGSGRWDLDHPKCRDWGNCPIITCGWLFCTVILHPSLWSRSEGAGLRVLLVPHLCLEL